MNIQSMADTTITKGSSTRYSRFIKAIAPLWMAAPMAMVSTLPLLALMTRIARETATTRAVTPVTAAITKVAITF